jgi:RHS repeat-associated protein
VSAEGERENPHRYTGEHWDAGAGLLYLRARWYDPALGRFLTQDPFPGLALLPQTQHAYVYVGNNPVNLTDPSGEFAPIVVAGGVGGVIGAVGGGIGYVLAHPGGRPEDYARSGGFWRSVGVGAASGAVAGAVGWAVPSMLPAAGSIWGSMGLGAVSGSLAGGAGQIVANLLNPCVEWYEGVPQAVAVGGVTGGIAGGAGYGIRQWMANRIRSILPPTNRAGLRDAMPPHPAGMQNPQAHHDFPWTLKDWFAGPRRGLDVNNLRFGRWVEGTPPGPHQKWHAEYNAAWQAFKEKYPNADQWQVLDFLRRLLSSGNFPSR